MKRGRHYDCAPLARVVHSIDENGRPIQLRRGVCRKCGCTDYAACYPPCAWVDAEHTKCSTCYPKLAR